MKKKLKGSITIFLVIILSCLIVCFTMYLDVITYKSIAADYLVAHKNSVDQLAVFQNDKYLDLLGFSFWEKGISNNDYIDKFKEQEIDASIKSGEAAYTLTISKFSLSDYQYYGMVSVADRYCKYGITEEKLESVESSIHELSVAARTILEKEQEYTPYTYMQTGPVNEMYKNGFYDLFLNQIAFDNQIADDKYEGRNFYNRYDADCNYLWTYEDTLPSKEKIDLQGNFEKARYMFEKVIDGPMYHTSNYNVYYADSDFGYKYMMEMLIYSEDWLTCATDMDEGNSGLYGEYEYILFGNQSDRENISKVCEQIMQYRYIANVYSIITECKDAGLKGNSDWAKIVSDWALNESYHDTLTLLKGGRVETIKSLDSFVTKHDTEPGTIVGTEGGSGLEYRDYLRYFTFYATGCVDMVCYEMMSTHLVDWVEYVTGIDADDIILDMDVEISVLPKFEAVSALGYLLKGRWTEKIVYTTGVSGF